ncbi:MAG: GNAT family N-acetyltransferase [Firmicutes bacterium]|nr:GNAT family N-acetyltransferase [Bacillota bacterium]
MNLTWFERREDWEAHYPGHKLLYEITDETQYIITAFKNDELAGLMKLCDELENPDVMRVISIWINPKYRKQGLGTRMYEFLGQCIPGRTISAEVWDSNNVAQDFHERLGFVHDPSSLNRYIKEPTEKGID